MMNIGFLSLDILIIVVVFLFLIFLSFRKGQRLLNSLIFAVYPSLLIFKNFPYVKFEPGIPEAVSFLVIYGVLFFVFNKTLHNHRFYSFSGKVINYSLLSLSFLSLIISVSSKSIISLQKLYTFTGVIPNFVNRFDFGLILIVPLILILITSKKDRY